QEGRKLAFVRVGQSLMAVYNDLGLTVCLEGRAGTICCFSEDYRMIRAFLMGEERRARKKRASCRPDVASGTTGS
ncbi:MAG: lysylphosphatidylglycerol synthetase family protein, partial [Gluconobacter sp.]